MSEERVVPIQFHEKMVKEIEDYVDSGLYASKAEFVRESVRKLMISLRKELFFTKVENLKRITKKRKGRSVKVSSEFIRGLR